jgi:hypothetical protein
LKSRCHTPTPVAFLRIFTFKFNSGYRAAMHGHNLFTDESTTEHILLSA